MEDLCDVTRLPGGGQASNRRMSAATSQPDDRLRPALGKPAPPSVLYRRHRFGKVITPAGCRICHEAPPDLVEWHHKLNRATASPSW